MRKEILLAIVAGGLFGLIIAVGIWRARLFIKPESKVNEEVVKDENPSVLQFGITVSSPEQKDVITTSDTVISGITTPNAMVALSTEDNDYVTKANKDGSFEQEIELESGINEIILIVSSPEGETAEQKLVLVHSTKLLENQIGSDEDKPDATDSSDTKIRERIDDVLNSPKAYIGSVTDISESTIQISDFDFGINTIGTGEILQISTDEDLTDFVSIGKETKNIAFEDVAIGDFVIAMGYTNGNAVLESTRLLVIDTPVTTNRSVTFGSVKTMQRGDILMNPSNSDEEVSITTDKNTDVFTLKQGKIVKYDLDDVAEGSNIVVFGSPENAMVEARTVYIIDETDPSPTPENSDQEE